VVGCLVVCGVLAYLLAGKRGEFSAALAAAPLGVLAIAVALQALALVARSEAWHACVEAAGGTLGRRRLFRAASTGILGSLVNTQLGAAARITVLRRMAPQETPKVPALVASEVPILTVEAALAAAFSFTLVGPLGLPFWVPVLALLVIGALFAGLRRLAGRGGVCCGLHVLRRTRGRTHVVAFVLVAVLAQVARNWLMLHAIGVEASLFDSIAVLIAMVLLSQLPIGPSVGAAAVVLILGADGIAQTAAAGVLLTATGTVGALLYAGWAALDWVQLRLRARRAVAAAVPRPPALAAGDSAP
jgi:lysylphosphatidylglycerol synthase-like protein